MRACFVALSVALAFPLAAPVAALSQQPPSVQGAGSIAGNTYTNDDLKLKFDWPSVVRQQDPASAFANGVLSIPGLTPPESAGMPDGVTSCLRPLVFLRSPDADPRPASNNNSQSNGPNRNYATLLLAEINPGCLSPAEQAAVGPILPTLDKRILATPGMTQASAPASYTISGHKVFMVASQGHPMAATGQTGNTPTDVPFTLYTMAVSAEWNNRMLVWLMSANKVDLLDRLSKSEVKFGSAAAAPLYPLHLKKSGAIQPPPNGK